MSREFDRYLQWECGGNIGKHQWTELPIKDVLVLIQQAHVHGSLGTCYTFCLLCTQQISVECTPKNVICEQVYHTG